MRTHTVNSWQQFMARILMLAGYTITAVLVIGHANARSDSDYQERTESTSFSVEGRTVVFTNLVGQVEILPGSGSDVQLESTIRAGGKDAQNLLDSISIDSDEVKGRLEIQTVYPTDDYLTFYYREGSSWGNSNTRVRYDGERVRVTSKHSSKAADVHVNHIVYLPTGVDFKTMNAVGSVNIKDIEADLSVKTQSGKQVSSNTQGELRLDSGSGSIKSTDHRGYLNADTGSGSITASNVQGDVSADTGSGSIKLNDISGSVNADTGSGRIVVVSARDGVNADTGSGRIELEDIDGAISADTGSGSIRISKWNGGDSINLDTGSGSIDVVGNFGAVRNLNADTGSGSISLVSTTQPSMQLEASSNSRINVNFPDMEAKRLTKREFRGTLGSGEGHGNVSSGSGKVSFTML